MDQQEKEQQVAKLRQHRPWTDEDARFVLDACASSGETLEGFARRMKLVPQRLQWWRKRLGPGVGRGKPVANEAPAVPSRAVLWSLRTDLPRSRREVSPSSTHLSRPQRGIDGLAGSSFRPAWRPWGNPMGPPCLA